MPAVVGLLADSHLKNGIYGDHALAQEHFSFPNLRMICSDENCMPDIMPTSFCSNPNLSFGLVFGGQVKGLLEVV